MSDPDLVLRILRPSGEEAPSFRNEMLEFRREMDGFRQDTNERFERVEPRIATLELTVNSMAGHLFGPTHFVKTIDRRVRKLETRAAK